MRICALIKCRKVTHIAINLKETCYQLKTIVIDGFVYTLMALSRIKTDSKNIYRCTLLVLVNQNKLL